MFQLTGIVTQAKKMLENDKRPSSLRDYDCLEAKHIYDEAKKGMSSLTN